MKLFNENIAVIVTIVMLNLKPEKLQRNKERSVECQLSKI